MGKECLLEGGPTDLINTADYLSANTQVMVRLIDVVTNWRECELGILEEPKGVIDSLLGIECQPRMQDIHFTYYYNIIDGLKWDD